MKIAVIGTFVLDEIHTYDGKIIESLGGISYSTAMLANLLDENRDEIYPIANVGYDGYEKIMAFLTQYKNVKTDGIHKEHKKSTRVTLSYYSKAERQEVLQNKLSPINFDLVKKVGAVDVLLINFITGFELNRDELRKICSSNSGLTYTDFHSLCLGIDENGKRFHRKPQDWEYWLEGIDILQMNEDEANILSDGNKFLFLANKILNNGTQILNITLGSKGSVLFYKQGNQIISQNIPAFEIPQVVDVTGCGDAFAIGFIINYFQFKDVVKAATYANKIAGLNSSLSGIEQINSLLSLKAM